MKKEPLRVALFGAGKMGAHHIRAILAHGRAQLVAVFDPAIGQDDVTNLAPGATAFADAEALLRDARPDAVHICTPPSSHASLAKLAIEHGASIYVEKPVTLSTAEAEEVLALAHARGVAVCAGHQAMFEAPAIRLREHAPRIARIVHVESYFAFRKVRRNLSFVEQAIDILPHPVYLLVDALALAAPGTEIVVEGVQATADGEVRALVRAGDATGALVVSLQGRPVDHYLKVVGSHGSLIADFVRGSFTTLDGPGAGLLPLLTLPFRQARQMRRGAWRGVWNRFFGGGGSYPGLTTLTRLFHSSLLDGTSPPTPAPGILATVRLCERIGEGLRDAEEARQARALDAWANAARALPPRRNGAPYVLVTGVTGFLGARVATSLRHAGRPVRGIARRVPAPADRIADVEYVVGDLSAELPDGVFDGVDTVVHCAACTEGAKAAHERGTVHATRLLAAAAAAASVRRFIHISSLSVLKPGRGKALDEQSPVDRGNVARGPYAWAKAEAEALLREMGANGGLDLRIIRPGPIVDFDDFDPPGRLGRDLGSILVAVGSPRAPLSVVDVDTLARAIVGYVESFAEAPALVNLVEPDAPTRGDLVRRTLEARPWLRTVWFPGWLMAIASPVAVVAQRLILRSKAPIDLASAFGSERYDTRVARTVLERFAAPS